MIEYLIYITVGLVLYLFILSSVCLIRTQEISRNQKVGQFIFSLLVPIIGSCLIIHLLAESDPKINNWVIKAGGFWLTDTTESSSNDNFHSSLDSNHHDSE